MNKMFSSQQKFAIANNSCILVIKVSLVWAINTVIYPYILFYKLRYVFIQCVYGSLWHIDEVNCDVPSVAEKILLNA